MTSRVEVIQIQDAHRLVVGDICQCGQGINLLLHRTTHMSLHTPIGNQMKRILWQQTKSKHTCSITTPLTKRATCTTAGHLAAVCEDHITWCPFCTTNIKVEPGTEAQEWHFCITHQVGTAMAEDDLLHQCLRHTAAGDIAGLPQQNEPATHLGKRARDNTTV